MYVFLNEKSAASGTYVTTVEEKSLRFLSSFLV